MIVAGMQSKTAILRRFSSHLPKWPAVAPRPRAGCGTLVDPDAKAALT